MKRFYVKKCEGIVGNEYRHGWKVVERIGRLWGKKPGDELYYSEATYQTKKEALENCPK